MSFWTHHLTTHQRKRDVSPSAMIHFDKLNHCVGRTHAEPSFSRRVQRFCFILNKGRARAQSEFISIDITGDVTIILRSIILRLKIQSDLSEV